MGKEYTKLVFHWLLEYKFCNISITKLYKSLGLDVYLMRFFLKKLELIQRQALKATRSQNAMKFFHLPFGQSSQVNRGRG